MNKQKQQSKIDSLKNNKKLRVFLLFLTMSILFWTLIKLSKNYIAEVEFNLVYTEIPKNKLLQNEPSAKIKLTINTIGFKLLKYSFKTRNLNYSLTDLKRKEGSIYYSLSKSKLNYLQAQLTAETKVLKIEPDTLFFDLGVKKSKKVPIISKANLQFKTGYNLVKKYTLHPDVVTVSGPTKFIDSISEIITEKLDLLDISSSFEQELKLVVPNNSVALDLQNTTIKGDVEKITEGSFQLSYRVINLPKNYYISTFPKEVKVVYQVALTDYNKISENSFEVVCDYKETEDNNLDYLIPKVVEKPEILFDVKLVPNKIEFLIKK
jgi:hypothetical protein